MKEHVFLVNIENVLFLLMIKKNWIRVAWQCLDWWGTVGEREASWDPSAVVSFGFLEGSEMSSKKRGCVFWRRTERTSQRFASEVRLVLNKFLTMQWWSMEKQLLVFMMWIWKWSSKGQQHRGVESASKGQATVTSIRRYWSGFLSTERGRPSSSVVLDSHSSGNVGSWHMAIWPEHRSTPYKVWTCFWAPDGQGLSVGAGPCLWRQSACWTHWSRGCVWIWRETTSPTVRSATEKHSISSQVWFRCSVGTACSWSWGGASFCSLWVAEVKSQLREAVLLG